MVRSVVKNASWGQSIDVHLCSIKKAKKRFMKVVGLYDAWVSHEALLTTKRVDNGMKVLAEKVDVITPALNDMNGNLEFLTEKVRNSKCTSDTHRVLSCRPLASFRDQLCRGREG
jgi:hypothetical protein